MRKRRATDRLKELAQRLLAGGHLSADDVAPDSGVPTQIGRFRIVRELGRGGMGVVYEAHDGQLDRSVAIKLMNAEVAAPIEKERFRREALANARLVHPGVVRLFEVGTHKDCPFLVLELVEGETLKDAIERGVGLRETLRVGADLAEALAYIHDQGLVHRDVKPGNVLLRADTRRPQLTDFGLAFDPLISRVTRAGALVGTLAYMAPEQGGDTIGPPADVYALGATLYEMLAGRPPFSADGPMELLAIAAVQDPAPLRDAAPKAPEELCELVHRCLAKEPRVRPSAGEVSRALGDLVWTWQRRRRRWAVAVGVLTVSIPGAVWLWPSQAAPLPDSAAVSTRTTPSRSAEEAAAQQAAEDEARRELDGMEALDPRRAHAALVSWIDAHPEHPDRPRAEELRDAVQREFPVRVLVHDSTGEPVEEDVRARFLSERVLVTVGDARVRAWDLAADAALLWELERQRGESGKLVSSPDGSALVFARRASKLRVRDTQTGKLSMLRLPDGVEGRNLGFSRDGRFLAVGGDRGVALFEWRSRRLLATVSVSSVRAVAPSPDGGTILVTTGWYDGVMNKNRPNLHLRALDVVSGELRWQRPMVATCEQVHHAADGGALIGDRLGNLWRLPEEGADLEPFEAEDAVQGPMFVAATAHAGPITGVALTPGSERVFSLATVKGASQLREWSYPDRRLVRTLQLTVSRPTDLAISPDGSLLAVGTREGVVELHVGSR